MIIIEYGVKSALRYSPVLRPATQGYPGLIPRVSVHSQHCCPHTMGGPFSRQLCGLG